MILGPTTTTNTDGLLLDIERDHEESPSQELAMTMDSPKLQPKVRMCLTTSKSSPSFLPSPTSRSSSANLHDYVQNNDDGGGGHCGIGNGEEDHGFFLDLSQIDLDTTNLDAEQQKEEADSSAASTSTSQQPRRSSLKTSIHETIPICTKRSSWKKLPVPDLEQVKMKRVESLNSFFRLDDCLAVTTGASPVPLPPPPPLDRRNNLKKSGSRVSFTDITIREYGQTIGDNPSVSKGTPITLNWEYEQNDPQDLDVYEGNRCSGGSIGIAIKRRRRRTTGELLLNPHQRKNLLIHKMGHTPQEVQQATTEINRIKAQREVTKFIQSKTPSIVRIPILKLEEMKESAVRKYKKTVSP